MKGETLTVAALALLVLISALAVVYVKYESRKLFVELQGMRTQRDEMNIEWGRLQLEQSTWSTHGRVESLARDRLDMVNPTPANTVIVRP